MRTTTFIYILSCPKSGDVMYVGKSNDPKGRFSKHKRMMDNNKLKNLWIGELKTENLTPVLTIIDEVSISNWSNMEKFYISKFRGIGCKLFNTSIGGEGLDYGNQTSFNGRNARKVVSLTKDGTHHKTFDSAKEAAASIGKNNISSALNGVTKKAGGYIWIYEEIYKNLSKSKILKIVENANNNLSRYNGSETKFTKNQKPWNDGLNIKLKPNKNVHQYTIDDEFVKTWETAKQASISLTGNEKGEGNISKCARGKGKIAFKYKWLYNLK